MKRMVLTILMMTVIGGFVSSCAKTKDVQWLTDFEQAKALSKEKNLPILANFSGSDWCVWCIRLQDSVFIHDEFKTFASTHLILFNADFPRKTEQPQAIADQNKKLAIQYSIEGFPTVLILDHQGNVIGRTGFKWGGPVKY